ncbi:Ni/Fe hydrogenase subunit alpha [Geobacter argillaceus]|uniref:NAD(P)-dependent nickel-iron dehydrogenase catalytic subunit n=1 Tax=Geobacter argillaceus TaxID=345631 RepID=A0A562VFL5_9BACT|nr:Ni/Fe hydrogenase subunit alpha [Geobacter argillaceus]TWJ16594.1 NAD(P)-dependent nickel-iron dehydrogenase catalytic subunit [Geobacter argillaceus]
MAETISINPVTRIEGHTRIDIFLDDSGAVTDARFLSTSFRGFEAFCHGRSFWEMPAITARICGICPTSHALASALAGDRLLGLTVPPTAVKLRRILALAQVVQSHALSFFFLSLPDFIPGLRDDPARRTLTELARSHPDLVTHAVQLRRFAHEIATRIGGGVVHPQWIIPGGMAEPLSEKVRQELLSRIPGLTAIATATIARFRQISAGLKLAGRLGSLPTLYLGLTSSEKTLEYYEGELAVMDRKGKLLVAGAVPERFPELVAEEVSNWNYLKGPYYAPLGAADGSYRVGPLARLNLVARAGTRQADAELATFRDQAGAGHPVHDVFFAHHARLIEILVALERLQELLDDPTIIDRRVRSRAEVNQPVGIGVCEAPRGTLCHEYHVDEYGLLERVNLVIATVQNSPAMNRAVREIAGQEIRGGRLTEAASQLLQIAIRAYDPCISCATHAAGSGGLRIRLVAPDGSVVQQLP